MAHLLNPYLILASAFLFSAFIIPWARAKYSPQRITTFANLVLLLNCCLMAFVHRPYVFLVVAALGGMGWTLSASELWVASQRAMPDWARGRMNATMVMVAQAANALGGVIWGLAAHHAGVVPAFLGAAAFGILVMIIVRVVPALQISIDFTKSLSFESAPVSIFAQSLDPSPVACTQRWPCINYSRIQCQPDAPNRMHRIDA
jgi:MFS family permease